MYVCIVYCVLYVIMAECGECGQVESRNLERRRRRGESDTHHLSTAKPGGASADKAAIIFARKNILDNIYSTCAAHAIFCCKVNRSLFGRCCI